MKKVETNKTTKKVATKQTKKQKNTKTITKTTKTTKKADVKDPKTKAKVVKTDKAIKKEVKPIEKKEIKKIEKPIIKEEIKKEPIVVDSLKENKILKTIKENYKPIIIVAAIILAIIIIVSLVRGSNTKSYNLSEISEAYTDSTLKINLPKNWMISEDGEFYEVVNDKLSPRGAFAATISSKEEYDQMIEAYSQYYDLEYVDVNGLENVKITEEYQDTLFTYYLSFSEESSIANQVIFINVEDAAQLEILNNIK